MNNPSASTGAAGDTGLSSVWSMLSRNTIYKLGFVIVSLVLFLLLLRLGISIMMYTMVDTRTVHLIDGMVEGRNAMVFPQSESVSAIERSNNENEGIEFSWSAWIYVNNTAFATDTNKHKHIFSKGNNQVDTVGIATPSNGPGVYLSPNTNELVVIMDTFQSKGEEIRIPNLPMEKWFHLLLRCQDNVLDVFVNGIVARSLNLMGVPRQNYGNVYLGMNGGFDGKVSNLWYYSYGLGMAEIQSLLLRGPNFQLVGNAAGKITSEDAQYLSMRWFFSQPEVA